MPPLTVAGSVAVSVSPLEEAILLGIAAAQEAEGPFTLGDASRVVHFTEELTARNPAGLSKNEIFAQISAIVRGGRATEIAPKDAVKREPIDVKEIISKMGEGDRKAGFQLVRAVERGQTLERGDFERLLIMAEKGCGQSAVVLRALNTNQPDLFREDDISRIKNAARRNRALTWLYYRLLARFNPEGVK
ncbi:MAG: hypothetical protein A2W61_00010 [Deltaproteobacteria bacterium RIFCSPLOWO2_01_44_7]|nr:MAG: hypothetical protein A2712_00950 [Deltaproteobacteria bacterium RIFCSPHIGHO2_01_FULL_43_49]OGQ15294.1 MAG: hypothetical protein A3D22_04525 [Deltaproteobacteria bacterium RIFCSPHIGHO2_02_FULL_44_53]OGQ27082.1 MAG: hypothetical protein A3D98_01540 [Deltaproteobacteria bacterium RIFCSPHIGHO2_12_FULL_44_21]OGQ31810.1 MAG: hypothetical protein A2979_05685 [Deltaproteobacteria bacterium RIFCSPLOWO2_01_FULL_45_74]OGQ37624.1 MAG: hypothetical protein A2W61_00010 [Deltaproteobacteria bacterium 